LRKTFSSNEQRTMNEKNVGGSDAGARQARSLQHLFAALALFAALTPLAVGFIRYIAVLRGSIFYPYGLDYGEGVVWAQMREMVAGQAYGPVDVFPSLIFHYPPIYHLLTAALARALEMDELATGRLLSAVATLATAAMIGGTANDLVKKQGRYRHSWVCGLIAGLLVLSMMPILHWSRFMRVDMLALFFSFTGVYLGIHALLRPRLIHLAAVCFVAAIFTKQTSIAAPIAVFGSLFILNRRTAIAGVSTSLLLAGVLLIAIIQYYGVGFLSHILLYNINTVEWNRLHWIGGMFSHHALFITIALYAIATSVRGAVHKGRDGYVDGGKRQAAGHETDRALIIVLVFFMLSTMMLLTIVKLGSSYNYFLEWLCCIALLAGFATRDAVELAFSEDNAKLSMYAIIAPVAIGVQSFMLPDTPQDSAMSSATRRGELDTLVRLVSATEKPVISGDFVLIMRGGKKPVWDPFTFPELAVKGLWDDRPFIERICRHEFGLFITDDDSEQAVSRGYRPDTASAISSCYPLTRKMAGLTISMPVQP
jgi:hypothetical protein